VETDLWVEDKLSLGAEMDEQGDQWKVIQQWNNEYDKLSCKESCRTREVGLIAGHARKLGFDYESKQREREWDLILKL